MLRTVFVHLKKLNCLQKSQHTYVEDTILDQIRLWGLLPNCASLLLFKLRVVIIFRCVQCSGIFSPVGVKRIVTGTSLLTLLLALWILPAAGCHVTIAIIVIFAIIVIIITGFIITSIIIKPIFTLPIEWCDSLHTECWQMYKLKMQFQANLSSLKLWQICVGNF